MRKHTAALVALTLNTIAPLVVLAPSFAQDAPIKTIWYTAQGKQMIVQEQPELKPSAQVAPTTKQYFVGGGGVKHLGSQLAFPVRHPMKFANNCSHPIRHPLVAFGQFSKWVEPYNSGLSATSSLASIAGSAALQTLWTNKFKP